MARRYRDDAFAEALWAEARTERLFGVSGPGRTRALSTGVKIEKLGAEYDPHADTCIRAFVRLLAARGEAAAATGMGE